MLGLAELRRRPRQLAARGHQVFGIEGSAAVVALIAASLGIAAVWARPLDVAIREESLLLDVVELPRDLAVHVAVLEQAQEEGLHHAAMVLGAGGGVQVELDAELLPIPQDLCVVAVDDDARGDPLGVGAHGDGRSVDIGTGHHEHAVTDRTVIAGEHVGGQVRAGEMAEVARAARIGPCHGDEDRAGLGVGCGHGGLPRRSRGGGDGTRAGLRQDRPRPEGRRDRQVHRGAACGVSLSIPMRTKAQRGCRFSPRVHRTVARRSGPGSSRPRGEQEGSR